MQHASTRHYAAIFRELQTCQTSSLDILGTGWTNSVNIRGFNWPLGGVINTWLLVLEFSN